MLIPDISTCSSNDCKSFMISDTSGMYDSLLSDGGWGTPNILPTDIISATLQIYTPGNSPYQSTPDFITIDVTQTVNDVILPQSFENDYSFELYEFSNQDLGNNCNLPDGVWYIRYLLEDVNGETYMYELTTIRTCATECCVNNMLEKAIDARLCGKKCDDNSIKDALLARALLLAAAEYSMSCGEFDRVNKIINSAKKLCNPSSGSSSSGGCGCGCS